MSNFEIVAREDFSDVTYLLEVQPSADGQGRAARPVRDRHVPSSTGSAFRSPSRTSTAQKGTITLVIQAVGKTTREMQQECLVGTSLYGVIGPMGIPSPIGQAKKVACVGGGLGVAPIFPQARAFKESGAYVIGIVGFRTKDLIFWEDKFKAVLRRIHRLHRRRFGRHQGQCHRGIKRAIRRHPDIDEVVAIGPPVMMKGCAEATRPHKIKTMVSLNPLMVDGTGMCGGCRVKIGDQVKFACVDGPDFDGHQVDFDDLMTRLRRFTTQEKNRRRALVGKLPHDESAQDAGSPRRPARSETLPDPFDEVAGG